MLRQLAYFSAGMENGWHRLIARSTLSAAARKNGSPSKLRLTVGVPVNLPKTGAQALRGDDEPLAISINAQGQIFLQDTQIQKTMLVPRLKAIAGEGYDQRIYVRGDKTVNYGLVANVVSEISAAGFARVALVTEKAGQGK